MYAGVTMPMPNPFQRRDIGRPATTDVGDDGVCRKCGFKCVSSGTRNGKRRWRTHTCVPPDTEPADDLLEKADVAKRVSALLTKGMLGDRWLRYAKFALDYDLLKPEPGKDGRPKQIIMHVVPNSDVLDDPDYDHSECEEEEL